jgi:hypothetical protein
MMSKAFASLQISVGVVPGEEEAETAEKSAALELADELNLDSEGKAKTEFIFGDKAYIRAIVSDRELPYTMESNYAYTLTKITDEADFWTEETFTFVKTQETTLKYAPANMTPQYEWVGKAPGVSVVFSGKEIRLSAPAIGVLQVRYRALCDIWALWVRYPFVGTVTYDGLTETDENGVETTHPATTSIVVLSQEDLIASLEVTYKAEENSAGETEAYDCQVVMQCSGDPIANATVYFQGQSFVTGVDGLCDLGSLAPGTYSATVEYEGTTTNYNFTIGTEEEK